MAATARRLLDASTLCAIATVTPGGSAHLNTAYFAWSRGFDIVWLSEQRARHSRNLHANKSVAIGVYDSTQTWGKSDRGIQLFGSAREVKGENANEAETLNTKRFPDFTEADLSAYGFYAFRPRRLKLFVSGANLGCAPDLARGLLAAAVVGSAVVLTSGSSGAAGVNDPWTSLRRPLHLPKLAAGANCPLSRVDSRVAWKRTLIFGSSGIGRGPVYPGLPSAFLMASRDQKYGGRWFGSKVF